MLHTIEISDAAYAGLTQAAIASGTTVERHLEAVYASPPPSVPEGKSMYDVIAPWIATLDGADLPEQTGDEYMDHLLEKHRKGLL